MSQVATIHDSPSSGSSEQRGTQKSHTWSGGQRLGGPSKPASTPETVDEATPYQDQQNGSETYNNTTNNTTTNNNNNTIKNTGERNFGGGVGCTLTGFTIHEAPGKRSADS